MATIKSVSNVHITDCNGVTISDRFTAVYESGIRRVFKCRNAISKNVHSFITNNDNATANSITDKNGITNTSILWR